MENKNHQTSGKVLRGTEKGMFLYGGSTIVVLIEKNKVKLPDVYFENTKMIWRQEYITEVKSEKSGSRIWAYSRTTTTFSF